MIESFPMALATLPLSTLLLSQNQLKTIPNAPFETLKTLVLNGVGWDIQTLGSALAFFPNLKEIHFRDNNVTDLDINWSNIEVINIAGNKLTKWSQVQHLGKIQT
jgi:Leucine-rich repeat (LRR) protein